MTGYSSSVGLTDSGWAGMTGSSGLAGLSDMFNCRGSDCMANFAGLAGLAVSYSSNLAVLVWAALTVVAIHKKSNGGGGKGGTKSLSNSFLSICAHHSLKIYFNS